MKTILTIITLSLASCAGSGPGGSITPADAEAFTRTATSIYDIYERERRYQPTPYPNPYQPSPYGY